MGKETEKEVCVIITKSNQVKEIVFVDEDQATGYIEDRYREFIKTVPNYNFRESYLSPDRTYGRIAAGIFSVKIMLYRGNVKRYQSKWKDNK